MKLLLHELRMRMLEKEPYIDRYSVNKINSDLFNPFLTHNRHLHISFSGFHKAIVSDLALKYLITTLYNLTFYSNYKSFYDTTVYDDDNKYLTPLVYTKDFQCLSHYKVKYVDKRYLIIKLGFLGTLGTHQIVPSIRRIHYKEME